jgi:hypothetical protein
VPTVVTTHKTPFSFYLKAEGMFTLPETEQEVFDIVYKHLMKQKRRCALDDSKNSSCRYRGREGTKCAAGALIPDDAYDESIENCTWSRLVHERKVPFLHRELIVRFQRIHDLNEPEDWESILQQLADEYQLKVPEIVNG